MDSVRFICGTQDIHKILEQKLADFIGMDDAILFSSCFDTNSPRLPSLLMQKDALQVAETNTRSFCLSLSNIAFVVAKPQQGW